MLKKIKSIFAAGGLLLVGGAVTYFTKDVNYVESFGPGVGTMIGGAVGYAVPEGAAYIRRYLEQYAK